MTFVSLGLVFVMIGIVGLLLPYYPISGTLNNGPPRTYAKGGNSYQVDDTIWIVAAVCFVVCALLLRIGKGAVREAVPHLTAMMATGLVLSVMATSWSLLGLLASSERGLVH